MVSQYDYVYDEIGRRTSVVNSGTAFAQAAFSKYAYNDRSELTAADRYLGTDIGDTSNPVAAEQRGYQYDPIGNRNQATEAATPITYTANELNQYSAVDSFTPAYDADGNMTVAPDGMVYSYNAENRLVIVQPQVPAEGDTRLEFVYDYMGRRVQKAVSTYAAGVWVPEKDIRFVYDGWNLVKETVTPEGQAAVDKYYVWGLDLSQTLQGAGGVGGLLAAVEGSLIYHYCFDGNGNVGQVVDSSDGSIAAHYEYDPFGNTVHQSGAYADENAYRFSTKYFDLETGLYYYGYRFYAPELGRWVSRDPIEEDGGLILYGFVGNDGVNAYDFLGMWKATDDSSGESRRFYMWEKGDTIKSLAEEVKLEESDFDHWGVVEIGSKGHPCVVSVPNVWISADLLQGGRVWSRLVNVGGSVGQFLGTDVFTWGYKIIKPNYASELLSITKSNVGDIWGMVVFGHGGKSGYLGDYDGTDYINQSALISALRKQNFKLAKAYLMQCYSGNSDLVDWNTQWNQVAQDPYLYTGQNWLMIDMKF